MERRDFMKYLSLGGLAIAGEGLLLNCETSTDANQGQDNQAQAAIVQEAADFEAMGIQTYAAAAGSGLLTDPAVIDTALAFKAHHELHLDKCNELLVNFGRSAVDPANASPDPGVNNVQNQNDILVLALNVEFQAATFYFSKMINEVQDNNVLKTFANIMPIEVAHMITYKNVLNRLPAINGAIFELLNP